MTVLADYWIEHVDEARGTFVHLQCGESAQRLDLASEEARLSEFAQRWRQPVIDAGYPEHELMLVDGFLQWPLCVIEGGPLDGHPDVVRISPRYYREQRVLQEGVGCIVYEGQAVTPRTLTRVAIKSARLPEAQSVIDHELRVLRSIEHPNVVRAVDVTIRRDGRALVTEWCGVDLRELIAAARAHRCGLGIDFAISVGVQLLDALAALDRAEITHHEVRSDHVTLAADGTVRLIDFGYAALGDLRGPRPGYLISPTMVEPDVSYRLRYMSPEQVRGLTLDPRTDVFSAAGLICELMTNEHPVGRHANDFAMLMYMRDNDLAPPPALPPPLAVPLQRAFARDPDRRIPANGLRDSLIAGARREGIAIGPEVIARRLLMLGVPT